MENTKTIKNKQNEAKTDEIKGNQENGHKYSKSRNFWITKAIAEERGREEILQTTFKEFLLYIFFVIFVTIYITGIRNRSVFYLTKGLVQQFTEKEFETLNSVQIKFEDIRTAADVWFYIENHVVNSLFWESTYSEKNQQIHIDKNAMNILNENRVLGVPRIRQVKMHNDSCVIHEYFRRLFLSCYNTYSITSEDKEPFGLKKGKAWTYSDKSKTKSLTYKGIVSNYGGGGFYTDFTNNQNKTFEIIENLKTNLWITRGTRAVFIDFSVYNANLNIFGICKLIFEFPTTGGVMPSCDIRSMRLIRFHNKYDYFVLFCECCFYGFIVFYCLEEMRNLLYFKLKYFLKFWSYIGIAIISCSLTGGITSIIVVMTVHPAIELIKTNPNKYGNLEYLAYLHELNNNLLAVDLFFIYIKVFKYLNFNRTMGQLNNTLKKCAWDILGFSIMFFIIFFAFAELGYLLFGNQVENFSHFGIAMFTLLRTILGDFDYSELENANRILAPIYFLSYIFLVFFVLLNMFLAIINDTYADVKTEIAIAPDEMQMTEYLHGRFNNLLRKFGCATPEATGSDAKNELNVTIRQIREALKKCGFSDLEIEMFFTRYNIDPLAETHIQDADKLVTELEKVLKDDTSDRAQFVRIDDFLEQQKKLEQIDKTIGLLVQRVKVLISKLEQMENVRKQRKTAMD